MHTGTREHTRTLEDTVDNRNVTVWLIITCIGNDFAQIIYLPEQWIVQAALCALHECSIDLFITGVDKRTIIVPMLACTKFNTPVATLLSQFIAVFPIYNFLLFSAAEHNLCPTQTHTFPFSKKPLTRYYQGRQNKPFSFMSGFLLHFNGKQIRVRRLLLMRSVCLDARCSGVLVLHIREVWLWVEPCIFHISGRNDRMRCD